MAEKKISTKITRKIIPLGKVAMLAKPVARKEVIEKKVTEAVEETEVRARTRKVCFYCQNKSNPSYTDLISLRRFLTDRAKIVSKERSGVCSKHQRQVARHIKYARHLSLLPFVPKV